MDETPPPRPTDHALDLIWASIYPGDRAWQYPAEVARHAKQALDELKGANAKLAQENRELVQELVRLQNLQHNPGLQWIDCAEEAPDEDEVVLVRGYSRDIMAQLPHLQVWWCRVLQFRGETWRLPPCEDSGTRVWNGFPPLQWARINTGWLCG